MHECMLIVYLLIIMYRSLVCIQADCKRHFHAISAGFGIQLCSADHKFHFHIQVVVGTVTHASTT